ncbi:putative transporter component [Halalkaliarchaeum sp. AArc-CO]|uniref:DUF6691 family protein n=1 Tax=unclassified Halalkaliarchaeum TaxID=2678344 RepID=UPI00217EB4EE|nr:MULTISPECIES: DUF6691 family protein [unclassified Halalkaliarchaeum]MDR5673847.1 YeeE/YedE thiosulfate transporter family protein [Halalkaliarchaeum sp. AArc-GB]UWG50939.1 putative transporter component [Halalkaliarchaeum sp. AArc-CO]
MSPTAEEGSSGETDGGRDQHPLFLPTVFLGGVIFGAGLSVSRMARPEIVLEFLQFRDLGLLFVMGGAAVVVGISVFGLVRSGRRAPLTGDPYRRRLKSMDRNVILGGGIFGVGWGLSGICPGAAYASLGIGNVIILYGIAGMFLGAYLQGYLRELTAETPEPAVAD